MRDDENFQNFLGQIRASRVSVKQWRETATGHNRRRDGDRLKQIHLSAVGPVCLDSRLRTWCRVLAATDRWPIGLRRWQSTVA